MCHFPFASKTASFQTIIWSPGRYHAVRGLFKKIRLFISRYCPGSFGHIIVGLPDLLSVVYYHYYSPFVMSGIRNMATSAAEGSSPVRNPSSLNELR
jgi:hypothetical protein